MAAGVYSLRRVQLGWESSPGTPVAATALFAGTARIRPMINRELEDYPQGVRADVIGSDVTTWRGCEIEFETTLDYEQVLYPLQTGIVLDAAPTGGDTDPYTWSFPGSAGAVPSLAALTCEGIYTDGSSVHHEVQVTGLRTSQMVIVWAGQQRAILRWTMFGKVSATSFTEASGLGMVTGRKPLPALLASVAINDTWAALGNTKKLGLVRAGTLTIDTGVQPDYTLDGASDLAFTALRYEKLGGSFASTLTLNADAKTERDAWFAEPPTPRFYRVEMTNGGSGAALRTLQFDFAGQYIAQPEFTNDGQLETMSANLALRYDTTGTQIFAAKVINGLDDVPGEEA